jgi:hypothetical protein
MNHLIVFDDIFSVVVFVVLDQGLGGMKTKIQSEVIDVLTAVVVNIQCHDS